MKYQALIISALIVGCSSGTPKVVSSKLTASELASILKMRSYCIEKINAEDALGIKLITNIDQDASGPSIGNLDDKEEAITLDNIVVVLEEKEGNIKVYLRMKGSSLQCEIVSPFKRSSSRRVWFEPGEKWIGEDIMILMSDGPSSFEPNNEDDVNWIGLKIVKK